MALKSEGVHVRGGEVCLVDFIRYHPKAIKQHDGAQKRGGKSVISDDILRQLQVMFPWMSIEEIKEIASKKVGAPVGAYVEAAYVGGSGLMKVVPDVVVVPDDVMASLAKELQDKKDELDESKGERSDACASASPPHQPHQRHVLRFAACIPCTTCPCLHVC